MAHGIVMSRRSVIRSAAAVVGVSCIGPAGITSRAFAGAGGGAGGPPEPLDPDTVRAFVGMAHRARDIDAFTAMLDGEPTLINACVDLRAGDFETALGAAAHVGNAPGMALLLERGARLDVFAAAALGYMSVVRAAVEADPRVAHAMGPHGIPLIAHARAGEHDHVVEYLRSVGADDGPGSVAGDLLRRYTGRYEGDAGSLRVELIEGGLRLSGDESGDLSHARAHAFSLPTGASTRDVQFRMSPLRSYSIRIRGAGGWSESFLVR